MKTKITLGFFMICTALAAQSDTEVYVLDIVKQKTKIKLLHLKNISNNEGYDNQPSFYDNDNILFSSNRNGQTDIALYNIKEQAIFWKTNTVQGSEYSPLKIPNKEAVSAIRLDTNGLQRLYHYNWYDGNAKVLLENLKVGYHVWYDENTLVSSVLVDGRMDLVISHLKDKTNQTVHKNVGRSMHKIPNSNLISFISNEKETSVIKSLDPVSGIVKTLISLPIQIKDMCWLSDNIMLIPKGKTINQFNYTTDDFRIFHRFDEDEINEISRISVSPDGRHLAMVSEVSPVAVVQKQVASFNAAHLNDFAACYAENVVVRNFPNDIVYTGKALLKLNYKRFFEDHQKVNTKVIKRIVHGNVVVDEVLARVDDKKYRQVVIYKIKNGLIASMTFIRPNQEISEAAHVVQQRLNAYNARDIDTFVNTFSDTVKVYDFPNTLNFEGQEQLGTIFSRLFSKTPDLHCKIITRMVVGNIVIEEEDVTANGDHLGSVAIYEVKNAKISKMTFIQ